MSYKQKNRIRGISYGPSGSYETPTPIKVKEIDSKYHRPDIASASAASNSGADGNDDSDIDNVPDSAEEQQTSNPAQDDLDKAIEKNIQSGSQTRKIKQLTADSKDATLSPRKRYKASKRAA